MHIPRKIAARLLGFVDPYLHESMTYMGAVWLD